jgi:sugar lactone lactonase YvrE
MWVGNVYAVNIPPGDINCVVIVFASLNSLTSAPGTPLLILNDSTLALNSAGGIALDLQGNMFIADWSNKRIAVLASLLSITPAPGTEIYSLADETQPLTSPNGVALDSQGRVYVADYYSNHVVIMAGLNSAAPAPGTVLYSFSSPTQGINGLYDLTLDAAGNMLLCDYYNNRVAVWASLTSTSASPGTEIYSFMASPYRGFNSPGPIILDKKGNIYLGDRNNFRIVVLASLTSTTVAPGIQLLSITDSTSGLSHPQGLAFDAAENLYVVDAYQNRVAVLASMSSTSAAPGTELKSITDTTTPLKNPWGIALDSAGNMYIADAGNLRVVVLASLTSTSVAPGTELFSFNRTVPAFTFPLVGLTLDSAGNIFVADADNLIIYVLASITSTTDKPGTQLRTIVDTQDAFHSPEWPILDGAGNIIVSDEGWGRVVVLASLTSTTATPGTQLYSFTGNASRPLLSPLGTALDSVGNLYIVDWSYSCIVVLSSYPAVLSGSSGGSGSSTLGAGSIAAVVLGILFCCQCLVLLLVLSRRKSSSFAAFSDTDGGTKETTAIELEAGKTSEERE